MVWRTWEHMTTEDLSAVSPAAVAVLPVAAIEQHGPHLPVGTDAILTDAVVARTRTRSRAGVDVCLLPTQRIGLSPEHLSFPGTLSLRPETVIASWVAIGQAAAATGLRRLVILNGHGGQIGMVDAVATELRRSVGMTVARATTFHLLDGDAERSELAELGLSAAELRFGLHGGMLETSMMLAAAPELVRQDRAQHFASSAETIEQRFPGLEIEGRTGLGWMAEDLHPAGVTGDASAASAALGERVLDRMADRLAALIDDLAAFEGLGTSEPSS